VPSHGCRGVMHAAAPLLEPRAVLVSATKGLEAGSMLRMSQVAALLGYVEQSSFSHAFKRWYGTTPSAWRKAR